MNKIDGFIEQQMARVPAVAGGGERGVATADSGDSTPLYERAGAWVVDALLYASYRHNRLQGISATRLMLVYGERDVLRMEARFWREHEARHESSDPTCSVCRERSAWKEKIWREARSPESQAYDSWRLENRA